MVSSSSALLPALDLLLALRFLKSGLNPQSCCSSAKHQAQVHLHQLYLISTSSHTLAGRHPSKDDQHLQSCKLDVSLLVSLAQHRIRAAKLTSRVIGETQRYGKTRFLGQWDSVATMLRVWQFVRKLRLALLDALFREVLALQIRYGVPAPDWCASPGERHAGFGTPHFLPTCELLATASRSGRISKVEPCWSITLLVAPIDRTSFATSRLAFHHSLPVRSFEL